MRNLYLPVLALSLAGLAAAQKPAAPVVVKLEPPDGAMEVDAKKVVEIVAVFDQPMSRAGWSFCGGGPTFPKGRNTRWKNKTTIVMKVELEPDHSYVISLNCPSARNFRSKAGVPLASTPWRFSTLPAKLPSKKKQRALNKKSLEELKEALASRYSYYDHHGIDWKAQFRKHDKAILACRTTRGWASEVGRLVRPTNDLHLYLRIDGQTVASAGRRAIDSLYRYPLLKKYLNDVKEPTPGVVTGKTDDGIGYLMISSWTNKIDFDRVEELLAGMSKAKGLIIDVRPNSGGVENLAARVAQRFVKGQKVYAKNRYRVRAGKKGFGSVLSRRIQGNPAKERYAGRVAVLMSRYCMSSCEAFLLMMKQGQDSKLIGQRSYGSSANPKAHTMPNGVEVVLPSWQAMRPDGTCFEGEGIAPDIEVVPTAEQLSTVDPILERGLAWLRGKN